MAVTQSGEFFDDLETMTPQEREKYANRKLSQTVKYACQNAPAAKKLFDRAGISPSEIRTVKDLEKLLITRKVDVIDWQKQDLPYGGLLATPPEEVERVFISPGIIYEPHQRASVKWFAKSLWAAGVRKGDVALNAFTYHMSPAGILIHEGLRDCGATVVPIGTGNTDIQVQTIRDLRVTAFAGTPSFLLSVIKRAGELGYNWHKDFALKRAWFTGEMLSSSMRQTFEQDYGLATFQAYAVTEPGGAIAYECREKSGLHFMDEYLIEIVDPQTGKQLGPGEVGEIVVTPVHNKIWGLVRFGTGDLSSYTTEPCSCGRTAYRLTGILGRTGDAVKVRGMFVVTRQAEQVIAKFGEVARFQMVVTRPAGRDELTLKLELKPDTPGEAREKLVDEVGRSFQDACRIKPDRIDFLAGGMLPEQYQKLVDQRVWE